MIGEINFNSYPNTNSLNGKYFLGLSKKSPETGVPKYEFGKFVKGRSDVRTPSIEEIENYSIYSAVNTNELKKDQEMRETLGITPTYDEGERVLDFCA